MNISPSKERKPKVSSILYTSKTYSDNTHPIMIRVSRFQKRYYKSIGHSIIPQSWDFEKGLLYESKPRLTSELKETLSGTDLKAYKDHLRHIVVNPLAKVINAKIEAEKADATTTINKLSILGESLEISNIKKHLEYDTEKESLDNFNSFFAKRLEIDFNEETETGTYNTYKTTLALLNEYQSLIPFNEITEDWIKTFYNFLRNTKHTKETSKSRIGQNRFSPSYTYKVMTRLKRIYNKAYKDQIKKGNTSILINPFDDIEIKRPKTKKDKLTIEEIKSIKDFDTKGKASLRNAKNTFLFSFNNAGIRIGDLLQLKWSDVKGNFERIEYKMDKVGKSVSLIQIPESIEILKKYWSKSKKPKDFIFPYLPSDFEKQPLKMQVKLINSKSSLINNYLKVIQKELNISTNISNHIARHSFADIARKKDISVFKLSKLLRHSSIKITESYLSDLSPEEMDLSHNEAYSKIYE